MVKVATNALPDLEDALGQSVRRLAAGYATAVFNELAAPWGLHFPTSSAVAGFHLACAGGVWIAPERGAELWLAPGDLVLFPFGSGHRICDQPDSPVVPYAQAKPAVGPATHALLCGAYKLGGGAGAEATLEDPLLAMLPQAVHVRAQQIAATPAFAAVLAALREEASSNRPGRDAVITSLVGAAFVYIVRSWLEGRDEAGHGWIGAPRDPRMTRTLAAIHAGPAERWTVEKLAEIARMSRASFARRFTQLVGETPLAYVAARRLDLAARLLRESEQQLGEIAATVGYESEFALSRAFKRSRNVAPGRYRAMYRAGVELR
jgi:AraC-like DNA-binding protein